MALRTSSTETTVTANWSSHGTSGNLVSYYFLEVYRGSESSSNLVDSARNISSSTRSHTFRGLSSDTNYLIKLWSRNSSNQTIKVERQQIRTQPGAPSRPTLSTSVSGRTVEIWGYAGSNTSQVRLFTSGMSPSSEIFYTGSNGYYSTTRTGNWNTSYEIHARGERGSDQSTTVTSYVSIGSPPPEPPDTPTNFRVYDRTSTTLGFAWNTVPRANRYVLEIYRSSNDTLVWDSRNIRGGSVWSGTLTRGVSYYAKLYASGDGGNSRPTYIYSLSVGYERPRDWSWITPKTKGRGYNIRGGYWDDLVTYDELVSFRDRINAFRQYKELSSYSFSSISKGQVFTATMYNQMETAISSMSPPTSTYGQQSSGSSRSIDELLNRLRDSLNSIR